MRIYITIFLIALIKTQGLTMPSGLQKDFGDHQGDDNVDKDIADFQADIHAKIKEDHETQKAQIMSNFLTAAANALNDHISEQNTTVGDLGHFKVQYQTICELNLPPHPEIPEDPTEKDCLSGGKSGKYLAEAVTKITKDNLQTPDKALGIFYECELLMKQELSLTLYNTCLEEDFVTYYEMYFNDLIDKMKERGFEYNEESQKFVYVSEKIQVGEVIEGYSNAPKLVANQFGQ